MSLEKETECLHNLVQSVVIIPSTPGAIPTVFDHELFKTHETRNNFLKYFIETLNDDCEIIITAATFKMHAHNFDGVYRFDYKTIGDVVNLFLVTPVGVDVLLTKHFQEFLNAVNEWFLEGGYDGE